jgi:HD-GYP domain-containing protein (c-di-GMP phosphodiesterase class II)
LREDKPIPSPFLIPDNTVHELEALGFKLISYGCPSGTARLPQTASPSLLLVLAGHVVLATAQGDYPLSTGDSLIVREPQLLQLNSSSRLWQVTGSEGALSSLARFGAQLRRKDPPTAAHSARVALLAAMIGEQLGLSKGRLQRLSLAAYLHDLGKLKLPSGLLRTPKHLTLAQWQLMTRHPSYGRELLEATPLGRGDAGAIIEQHHERLDGSGYPAGLTGDVLLLESGVLAVADTFDAITHARPYQEARSTQQALSEINRYSDRLYPREVVTALNTVASSL